MSRFRLSLVCLVLLVTTASAQNLVLGFLEDIPEDGCQSHAFGVRVAFRRTDLGWQPFPSECRDQNCLKAISSRYPGTVVWTIAFDGKNLGQVKGRTPKEYNFYSRVGLQEVVDSSTVPVIGQRSSEFAGFAGCPLYRALVANSKSFFRDPESWKPLQPSTEVSEALHRGFRKKFPKLCELAKDESTLKSFPYRDQQVKIVKSYRSKDGRLLARLHLATAIDCEDTEAGDEINDPWFALDSQGVARYLDSGMWLVDAGDYDNDGKSELVFSIDRYNRGGYEIFYDDLAKHATFEFNYH